MRVVSLLPSLSEIVHALGCGDQLVGRSHECDFPAGIESLPICTAPKFRPDGSSREIDGRVRALVEEGLSVYRVDADLLRELAPDVILTQDHCEVCAASLKDVENAVCDWTGTAPRVVSLSPMTLGDVWEGIAQIGVALDVPDRGGALVQALTDRITEVGEKAGALRPRPSVACIEWINPLMSAGNWMPELVALAGGHNLFGTTGEHSPWLEWDAIRSADPDVIAVLPCGFDIPRTLEETPLLEALPGWSELRAVKDGRVFVTDGNQYFNRPGPRLAESLEILAELLHPDVFAGAGPKGAWQAL